MTHPYARDGYLAALCREPGEQPLPVPAWGTALLSRPLAEDGWDAAGAYPMAVLDPAADLAAGMAELARTGAVSVVLVADPLHGPPPDPMGTAFDLARPFKTHSLVDPRAYAPTRHHRQEIRRSQRRCQVEEVRLGDHLPTWIALYAGLVDRHAVQGPAAFTDVYAGHLAAMDEIVCLTARVAGEIAAMGLWFAHGGVAYNHLGASSAAGYAGGVGYALYDAAISRFGDCRWINLGAGAGAAEDPADGLATFKRGFASDTATAWLYGKVLDPVRYAELASGRDTQFFPAYRG